MLIIPNIEECVEFAKQLGCSWIGAVECQPSGKEFDCHNNCLWSEYERVVGFYFWSEINTGIMSAMSHSVINDGKTLVDITVKGSDYIIFGIGGDQTNEHYSYIENSVCINKRDKKLELSDMYYVYALIDPRNNTPFYVGKGKKERWKDHLNETLETTSNKHKFYKIEEIRRAGEKIAVEFLATSILDEKLAYEIEEKYIEQFGRSIDGGLLTNFCKNARPPCHKGKSYLEIYGDSAEEPR